eukprot:TRINITY_DN3656_c1_g7_i1.p1 TRINITY_DN3656_c1_g7~~TRINITY_DN3656_c1_g7_i1.p1  ORF type:complete len:1385 (-),score=333.21 TRINITY_DN3656_c1_g7_i1:71-4147(-)
MAQRGGGGSGYGGHRRRRGEPSASPGETRAQSRSAHGGKRGGPAPNDPYEQECPRSRSPPRSRGGQTQSAPPPPPDAPAKPAPRLPDALLQVTGCGDKTIGERIMGEYAAHSTNHGKLVFKKVKRCKGHDVFIYFWDERDGPDQCGWWFGPEVGGNQVWAYHPSRTAASPPSTDWNVPHDGDIDRRFLVSAAPPSARKAAGGDSDGQAARKQDAPDRASADRSMGRSDEGDEASRGGAAGRRGSARNTAPAERGARRTDEAQQRGGGGAEKGSGSARDFAENSSTRGGEKAGPDAASGAGGSTSNAASRSKNYFVEAYRRRKEDEEFRRKQEEEQDEDEDRRQEDDAKRRRLERGKGSVANEEGGERGNRGERGRERPRSASEERQAPPGRRGKEDDTPRGGGASKRAEGRRYEASPAGSRREAAREKPQDEGHGRRRAGEDEGQARRRDEDDGRRRREGESRRNPDEDQFRGRRREEDERRRPEDDDRRRRHEDDRGRRRPEDDERRRREEDDDRKRRADDDERRRHEDDDRRRRDEDDRKRRDEDRRREEEDRKRRDERDRRLQEEKRTKEEEHRRREEELQRKRDEKRREEEEKRKQEEDAKRQEEKKKNDEVAAKKSEEDEQAKKAKESEEKQQRQQQATLNVLRVLQQLSNANPENFETLKSDLAKVMATELPETGSQEEILKMEANRVLEHAQHYVEQVKQQQVREAQAVEEQERISRELLDELERLVRVAEVSAKDVQATTAPLAQEEQLQYADAFGIARAAEEAGNVAITSCSACAEFMTQKKATIEEAESIADECASRLGAVQPRIAAAARQATDALRQAKATKERIGKRCAAARRLERQAELFEKYDQDGDGLLSEAEVIAFAKGEHDFIIPPENLARIKRQLLRGGRGLERDDFPQLQAAIGIARDETMGVVRRARREENERAEREAQEARKAMVEERKVEMKKLLVEIGAEFAKEIEPKISAVEKDAEKLAAEAQSMAVDTLQSAARALEVPANAVGRLLAETSERVEASRQGVDGLPELAVAVQAELRRIDNILSTAGKRMEKVTATVEAARQLAHHWRISDYEGSRMEVAAILQACAEAKGGKVEDLFSAIVTPGAMTVSVADVKKYVEESQSIVDQEKLKRTFAAFGPGGVFSLPSGGANGAAEATTNGKDAVEAKEAQLAFNGNSTEKAPAPEDIRIGQEDFARFTRLLYKVVKEIVLTDNLLIEQSRQIRRLDIGEVMEVTQGPSLDPAIGIYRIGVKILKDGLEGWVTVAGNAGVTFLLPCACIFRSMAVTPLASELRDLEGTTTVTELREGLILELLDWSRTSRSSLGVTRIKTRLPGSSLVGWATTVGNDGVTYTAPA